MLAVQKPTEKLRDDLKVALTSTDARNSFGPPQFESISGLRWRKLGEDQNNKHEFKHVLTGFAFTIEAGADPKTHAITGEDPLNVSIFPDQGARCVRTPRSILASSPVERIEEMLKDEMEFSTKHLAHFFTKVLDFLMTVCQELDLSLQTTTTKTTTTEKTRKKTTTTEKNEHRKKERLKEKRRRL